VCCISSFCFSVMSVIEPVSWIWICAARLSSLREIGVSSE
jgi:hypothetical protein